MSDAKLYRPGKKVKHFQYNSRFLACDPALEEFHPNYRWQVGQRYSDMDVSLDDAVRAIQRGYTSAIAATQARVIPPLKMREDNWSWPVRASDIEEKPIPPPPSAQVQQAAREIIIGVARTI